ncbi:hypothetical protein ARMSODRAFT_294376 [Armillaria solidipes]|uniref:Uncharacterized protein n=1 Tax=Armillaria solidipes TaxID=1076256 RepID=A0A2H3BYH0_9AGAR|nr:hypothetical protein ARMSODRAFT_294376 [Armillaria solidipes]
MSLVSSILLCVSVPAGLFCSLTRSLSSETLVFALDCPQLPSLVYFSFLFPVILGRIAAELTISDLGISRLYQIVSLSLSIRPCVLMI